MAPWTAVYSPASPASGPATARPVRPAVASASTKTMAEFDRVRSKALAVLRSDEWRVERAREAPKMKRYFPQIVRINELGLLTFDSQAGASNRKYKERAYCFGFVRDRAFARKLTEWVSLHTDKYASLVVVQGDGRPDPHNRFVASVAEVMLRTTAGLFPVTAHYGADGTMHVHSTVSPFTTPYYRHVVGTDPVPADAVCVMFADLVWGRSAGARDGLFTAIEKALVRVNAT